MGDDQVRPSPVKQARVHSGSRDFIDRSKEVREQWAHGNIDIIHPELAFFEFTTQSELEIRKKTGAFNSNLCMREF